MYYSCPNLCLLSQSCGASDVACRVLTRVLAYSHDKKRLVTDCGFTAITKQGFQELDDSFAIIEVISPILPPTSI